MRNSFVKELENLADKDKDIVAMLADNGIIVFDNYKDKYPNQFVNVGISESALIGMASGMAMSGLKPFVYTIIPFLTMRPYEFIKNDICYQNTNVKLIGIGAGFAYSTLGPTHHAIEDISIMNILPNLTIISPADPLETQKATKAIYDLNTPTYMRIGTGKNPRIYENDYNFEIGKGVVLKEGKDLTIISTGTILSLLKEIVNEIDIDIELINIHTIKPIDEELIIKSVTKTKKVITIEEHFITGGLGSIVANVLSTNQIKVKFKQLGIKDNFVSSYGSLEYLRKLNNLDKDSIKRELYSI